MKPYLTLIFIAMLLAFKGIASGEEVSGFEPPKAFRIIHFAEYGGGPIREYIAPHFEKSEVLFESASVKIVFTTSLPPTTATRTVVAGLFLLLKKNEKWEVADARRFEAVGKDSGAKAEAANSEKAEPHVALTLHQGGRGGSFAQCSTYKVDGRAFRLDLPQEISGGATASP